MTKNELQKYNLPEAPGVYVFTRGKGSRKKVLYVGKATSLRDRVRSYFDPDLIVTRGPRIVDMVTMADGLMHEVTPTVLEALVREAALIRRFNPPANALGKDDKSFLYACITKEEIPRVLMIRAKDIDFSKKQAGHTPLSALHGPFTSGAQLKVALKLIRKIFPFYDTPKPITRDMRELRSNSHTRARIEFNTQIGHYPSIDDYKEYQRSIKRVSLFLSGEVGKLRHLLQKEMKAYAKAEEFEKAQEIKRRLFALDHIQDVALIKDEHERAEADTSVRVEAFDTAHLRGSNAIGVMTVLIGGEPAKKEYRTFRIRAESGKAKEDDLASLREILSRRLGHTEWPLPKLFVIDGGRTHKKTAETVLAEAGVAIPVASVVKDEKHRPKGIFKPAKLSIHDADIILANAEAHRFAIARHRQALRKRALR